MNPTTRRKFLKQSGLAASGAAALAWAAPAVLGAEAGKQVVVGLIGCGGQGNNVADNLVKHGARLAYVCDPDEGRMGQAKQSLGADQAVTDLRKVLDDKSVDAVVIATPDHWHAPATILACDAGKHVYVEKPCAHNLREGRLMIDAARRNQRLVQVGTQSRSTEFIRKAMQLLRDGAIGRVLAAKAWNSQRRANIGHVEPSDPPAGFNYDLWLGPAPMVPYRRTFHPVHWRWWHAFGTGDAGNDGVHDIDIARWGLGVDCLPSLVTGYGTKLYFDDDQQFPDTFYVTAEYTGDGSLGKRRILVYEQRTWSPYVQEGHENGNAFYGTDGMLVLGKGAGYQLFGPRNKLIEEAQGRFDLAAHTLNFLDAIRSGAALNAEIETGHFSAGVSHLANIVSRVGRPVRFDPQAEKILDDPEADRLLRREYREGHWAAPKGV